MGEVKIRTRFDDSSISVELTREARALGFDCTGVTDPDSIAQAAKHFRDFLGAGSHGDMDWLAENAPNAAPIRAALWTEVRSVIMLGVNYGPDHDPLEILAQRKRGAISVYAQGDDYHDVIKKQAEGAGALAGRRMPAAT